MPQKNNRATARCVELTRALNHAMAGRVALRVERRTIRRFRSDWGTRKLVDRAFLEIGIERRTVFEVSGLETHLELVARDPAIALVPEAIAEARPARSERTNRTLLS
ncbi:MULTISPECIES: LysR substrate-binding domain-containing protein [Mesorhizobium]|uniref:LysR substrate-binding domain-containing protein n=1 Tax=Mesorhizobium TaxID=68287 RepID=UPI0010A95DAE|nr:MULTISPECIES: LysR substrate-binding domain-containing protein [Mesorhizobium]